MIEWLRKQAEKWARNTLCGFSYYFAVRQFINWLEHTGATPWGPDIVTHHKLQEQRDALRAALEAAPKPRKTRVAGLWRDPDWRYVYWYNGERQAALGVANSLHLSTSVEDLPQSQNVTESVT